MANASARPNCPRFTWIGDNLAFGGATFVHFYDRDDQHRFFRVRQVVRIFDSIDARGRERITTVMRWVDEHGSPRLRYLYRCLISRCLQGGCND